MFAKENENTQNIACCASTATEKEQKTGIARYREYEEEKRSRRGELRALRVSGNMYLCRV
jgi:hypothetical protein